MKISETGKSKFTFTDSDGSLRTVILPLAFARFLFVRDAYYPYLDHIRQSFIKGDISLNFFETVRPRSYISAAFLCSLSPYGYKFWFELNNDWDNVCAANEYR